MDLILQASAMPVLRVEGAMLQHQPLEPEPPPAPVAPPRRKRALLSNWDLPLEALLVILGFILAVLLFALAVNVFVALLP